MAIAKHPGIDLHPGLVEHLEERAQNLQDRTADAITAFAGSMYFVYVHIVWFALWIAFRIEHYPFGLLTMIVSLEAIFLSTFVMISQNRQDDARQHMATREWNLVNAEKEQNDELIRLSKEILDLTHAVHQLVQATPGAGRQGES